MEEFWLLQYNWNLRVDDSEFLQLRAISAAVLILYGCLERMRGREENQSLSILRLSPSHLHQPVCSLNWLILVVTSFETGWISFEWLCSIKWHVFSICIWLLPLVFTSIDDMCIRVQNVFWEWECVQTFAEICKFYFTRWNCLRYWQQTPQLAKWVQATENFVQPMGF